MSDVLNLAVVGLRFGLEVLRRDYLNPSVAESRIKVVGVCDLDPEKARMAGDELNLKVYASLEEILDDPDIDGVGLFTGPNGRADLIRKIIRAGKHVMTTKPFELDEKKALDVLNEAKSLNKAVHLNSPGLIPSPVESQIQKWIEAFDLGRLVSVQWETHGNYHEKADGSWYDDLQKCPVAPIFRLGIYGINRLIRLCGAVDQVSVVHSRIRTERPTPDNALLSLCFKNGAVGSVHASFCVGKGDDYINEMKLHYVRGTIRVEGIKQAGKDGSGSSRVSLQVYDRDDHVTTGEAIVENEDYQWTNFYEVVKTGRKLPGEITHEQIIHGIRVINGMADSERTGRTVTLAKLT